MTSVMRAIDAPSAWATADQTTGSAADSEAVAHFGALVDEALGALENRGRGAADRTTGERTEDDDQREDENTTAATATLASPSVPSTTSSPTALTTTETGASEATAIEATGGALDPTGAAETAGATTTDGMQTGLDVVVDPQAGRDVDPSAMGLHVPADDGIAAGPAVRTSPPAADDVTAELVTPSISDDAAALEAGPALEPTTAPLDESEDRTKTGSPATPSPATQAGLDAVDGTAATEDADQIGNQASQAASDMAVESGEPWAQVARALHRIRRDENGTHTMTVRLDPPDLGTVEIEVQVRDGLLHVRAAADSMATREALARAMPELRASLDATGITAGSLDVGARAGGQGLPGNHGTLDDGGAHDGRSPAGGDRASGTPGGGPAAAAADIQHSDPSRPARLDLRL